MTTMTFDLDPLRDRVEGPVLLPDEPGFADELAAQNTIAVHRPQVAVGVAGEDDVVQAVRFAREVGLPVRVHATGHGAFEGVTDGMLLSTRRLDAVAVDPATGIASFGAGARWSAIVAAAADHGLAPITGSSTNVGAVGYLLGGGLGPLSRSHGFSSDYVRGFRVVTGTGELVEATAVVNPDLFWALRGGKGGLGVVTVASLELVQLETLYAGSLMFAEEHIETVLRAWVDWTATAPEAVTTSVAVIRFPPMEVIPEPLRGRTLLSLRFAFPGDPEVGARLAQPLRDAAPVYLDDLAEMSAADIAKIHNDPIDPAPGWDAAMLLTHVDQDFASVLLEHVGPGVEVPVIATEIRHLGGRTTHDPEGGTAVGGRPAAFTFGMFGAPDPALFTDVLPALGARVRAALAPWIAQETNINFAGRVTTAEQLASAWPTDTYARLAEVRARYDPDGIFPYGPR
jgi:hypothetical protein